MKAAARLGSFPAFAHLGEEHLARLAECASRVRFSAGATILKQGEQSQSAYVVDKGRVRVKRETPYGTFELATLGEGDVFGESAFIDQEPRSMDAVADTAVDLYLLEPAALGAVAQTEPRFELALYWAFWKSLSHKLRATNERLTRFFTEGGKAPAEDPVEPRDPTGSFRLDMGAKRALFGEQRLAPMEINFLASLSKEQRLAPGEVLFREGDPGHAMYIVLDGRVRIGKHIPGAGEEALAFMERGDFFGEMALIDNEPRSAEATAHEEGAVVLAIPREVVEGILDIRKVSSLRLLRILCSLVAKRLREIDDKLVGWFILSGGEPGHAH
ncbi:MAG TPA: cyclic nucleotide-binding domain-containing protein [Thermoanaerobaculia bacterium]|nr:cyclic nucleotide-binding domain-containing protein [Thermoanaerobaculia bacterium]